MMLVSDLEFILGVMASAFDSSVDFHVSQGSVSVDLHLVLE